MIRRLVLVALTVLVTACSPRGAIVLDPAAAEVGTVRSVFVGTSRGPDPETGEEFSRNRSAEDRFARFDVSIPPAHQAGTITWTKPRHRPDPQTDFLTTNEVVYDSSAAFRSDLARAIRQRPATAREVIVFVHGFNNTFAEGMYRIAQLSNDLKVENVVVHYSWPSRANPLGYAYDRDSALFARDGFERLLKEVSAAGASRIVIVAHSMGSAVTMETLRQMAIAHDRSVLPRLGGVVLISPDLDVDVFRSQARRIGTLPQPFLIFTSKKDRALALAARLSGETKRLGNVTDVKELADLKVTLIEVSAFSTGAGHFTPGTSPALLSLLGQLSAVDQAFSLDQTGRTGLLPGVVLTVQDATQVILAPVTALSEAVQ